MRTNNLIVALASIVLSAVSTGCLGLLGGKSKVAQYVGGPVEQYMRQPVPEPERPVAQTIRVERVSYNTAASDRAVIISDHIGRGFYTLSPDVGEQVAAALQLGAAYSEETTMAAFEAIAVGRDDYRTTLGTRPSASAKRRIASTRGAGGGAAQGTIVAPSGATTISPSTQAAIQKHERAAAAASAKGDHASAELHRESAANLQKASTSFSGATSVAQGFASSQAALASAAIQSALDDFNALHDFLEHRSGAIGPEAPAGSHLDVYVLEYLDAVNMRLDSRQRTALLLVHTDASGNVTKVLEGSDLQTCYNGCNVFPRKPSTIEVRIADADPEVKELFSEDNKRDGLSMIAGPYQRLLLYRALDRLTQALDAAAEHAELSDSA